MKATINGKRYDSDKCEILAERDYHNHGNYSGTGYLLRANDGAILIKETSNGQDCYRSSGLYLADDMEGRGWIDTFDMTEEQEKRCAELGIIEIVK